MSPTTKNICVTGFGILLTHSAPKRVKKLTLILQKKIEDEIRVQTYSTPPWINMAEFEAWVKGV